MGIRVWLITAGSVVIACPAAAFLNLGVAIAVTIGLAVPPLYLTWRKYVEERNRAQETKLTVITDELAVAVQHDLDTERVKYQRNDVFMPLAWTAAPEDLVNTWSGITRRAAERSGRRDREWARRPGQLASDDGDLARTYAAVPTGQLVVLGRAGSGKSTLLTGLQRALLDQRRHDDPVPVMFALTTWRPQESDLRTWMVRQLRLRHEFLREQAPATRSALGVASRAEVLLTEHMILPILDGFDEIPERLRGSALASISLFLRTHHRLVLSSRTEEYRQAVRPRGLTPAVPAGMAGIELRDVPAKVARKYLVDTAYDGPSRQPWQRVFAKLGRHPQVAETLRTPLMIDLARTIYNPRVEERDGTRHDPTELLRPDLFPTPDRLRQYLLRAYLRACYPPPPKNPSGWSEEKAKHYLSALAAKLNKGFAWWQLGSRDGPPTSRPDLSFRAVRARFVDVLASGLVGGTGIGVVFGALFGPAFGVVMGVLGGLLCLLGAGLVALFVAKSADPHRTADPHGLLSRDRTAFLTYAFLIGPLSGMTLGLLLRLVVHPDDQMVRPPMQGWLVPAGIMSLAVALLFRFGRRIWHRLAVGACFGVAVWVLGVLLNEPLLWLFGQVVDAVAGRPRLGVATGLFVGAVFGTAIGFALAWSRSAWGSFVVARFWLAARKELPLRLMTFLEDARERGVLRRVGVYYHLRNVELQQALTADAPQPTAAESVRVG